MVEVWKKVPVEGFERYSISSIGQVRNDDRKRIMKNNLSNTRYYCIQLSGENKKHFRVHRLVALAFIPNPNDYPYVNHIDGDKENNCIENLEWCTQLHNTQSLNTKKRFGYIGSHTKNSFYAEVSIQGKIYTFFNQNRDKCEDWLNARKIELENNLNLTELNIRKSRGTIYQHSKSGNYHAQISINGKMYTGTFKTREDGQKYMDECYDKYK